jgi:hypothetical protein
MVLQQKPSEQESAAVAWLAGSEGLDGLPLALSQAGAYVRKNTCSFVEYKKIFVDRRTKVFEAADADPSKALYAWLQGVRLQKYAPKLKQLGIKSLDDVKDVQEEEYLTNRVGMADVEAYRFVRAVKAGVQVPRQTSTVSSTWRVNFEMLSLAAQQLLGAASLLAPDDIPDGIVPALARAPAFASASDGCSNALSEVFAIGGGERAGC